MKRPPLVNGEIYHIVLRAVEGLKLFCDKQDHLRMIHNLFEFNDKKRASSSFRVNQHLIKKELTHCDRVNLNVDERGSKREMLVEILAFCLMPNHIHLLLRQIKDGGITKFMRKVGVGCGCYYNKKYKRLGHVFGGRFRAVRVANDNQLKAVFVYINTNPAAILFPGWKEAGIKTKDLEKVIEFLEKEYRWSSYPDYLGNKNFPSITTREWLINEMGGIKEAQRFVNDWLKIKKELAGTGEIAIE